MEALFREEGWSALVDELVAADAVAAGTPTLAETPAALNFGGCMTYATARLAGEPLRFTGGDFAQTDLT